MYRVLITDPISPKGIEILEREEDVEVANEPEIPFDRLLEIVKDFDAIITRSRTPVNRELLSRAKRLKVIGRAGVGVDNVDLEYASKLGILVVNTPGANTIAATELTLMHMLNVLRNSHKAHQSLKEHHWDRKKFMGTELFGKTLGIIGLGNIGSQVAIRCKSFGMKVLCYDPYIPDEKPKRLGVKRVYDLYTLLKESDIITIHTPLTEETKGMIGEREFEVMKDGVYIINCARGGIIDERALLKYLKLGKVRGVGLDVFSVEPPNWEFIDELLKFENVSLSPHIGANTYESQENVGVIVAQQVIKALKGRTPEHVVNAPFPDLSVLPLIKPYLDLGEKLGKFLVQWSEGRIGRLRISVRGEISKHSEPIVSSVLKGILSLIVDEPVNLINANYVAKERGIEVEKLTSEETYDFKNLIGVESLEGGKSVSGSVLEGHLLRIVQIDEYKVDIEPEGIMLVFENKDEPGVIGKVGTLLGKNNINIAGFELGRKERGGRALGVLALDDEVPEEVLKELTSIPQVFFAKQVKI